jgi:hypothetical protein
MDAGERESFYDREIAPVLADLCRICHRRGFSFLAAVEWRPGALGRTFHFGEDIGDAMLQANAALTANGDFDTLLLALIEEMRRRGQTSAYLQNLGVSFEDADKPWPLPIPPERDDNG